MVSFVWTNKVKKEMLNNIKRTRSSLTKTLMGQYQTKKKRCSRTPRNEEKYVSGNKRKVKIVNKWPIIKPTATRV